MRECHCLCDAHNMERLFQVVFWVSLPACLVVYFLESSLAIFGAIFPSRFFFIFWLAFGPCGVTHPVGCPTHPVFCGFIMAPRSWSRTIDIVCCGFPAGTLSVDVAKWILDFFLSLGIQNIKLCPFNNVQGRSPVFALVYIVLGQRMSSNVWVRCPSVGCNVKFFVPRHPPP